MRSERGRKTRFRDGELARLRSEDTRKESSIIVFNRPTTGVNDLDNLRLTNKCRDDDNDELNEVLAKHAGIKVSRTRMRVTRKTRRGEYGGKMLLM